MASKKKIFDQKDFEKNKDRNIFSPEDFDKEKDNTTQDSISAPLPPEPGKSKWRSWSFWPSWAKGLVCIAIIIAVLASILLCLKSCGNESGMKEGDTTEGTSTVTQSTDVQDNGETVVTDDDASEATESETTNESPEESSQSEDVNKSSEPEVTNPVQPSSSGTPTTPTPTAGDVETEAMNVIRGDYGNAPVRYDLLRQKGLDAQAIQRRVNELKREGVF